jgi:hypothetical protein
MTVPQGELTLGHGAHDTFDGHAVLIAFVYSIQIQCKLGAKKNDGDHDNERQKNGRERKWMGKQQ